MTFKSHVGQALRKAGWSLEWLLEHIGTFMYREMLKRNTYWPMQEIIREPDADLQWQLVREWAHAKASECSYIQLAGGFLFTTVSSCLQWPGVQDGHWSASAMMYASVLLSLVAVVSGSQQLLVLPNYSRLHNRSDPDTSCPLPAQMPLDADRSSRKDHELDRQEMLHLKAVAQRFCNTSRESRPNYLHVFALQAPIMLLALAVLAFLAGLCAVIFAPLARRLMWDDDAKVAVVFGVVAILSLVVFMPTSFLIHGLSSLQQDPRSRAGAYFLHIRA